jgi:hypothetical protein
MRPGNRINGKHWILTLALLTGSLQAAEMHPSADAKIVSVQTAGSWENGNDRGSYRIVYWPEGFEHVSTGVAVEWIAEVDDANNSVRVVRSEVLVAPGTLSLASPKLVKKKNAVRLILKGVHTYSMQKISCEFELRKDASIKTIKDCG